MLSKMKIAFKTFGCRLNISETESLISLLPDNFDLITDFNEADIVIINSCTVTAEAEKKCIHFINPLINKGKICILTGCFNPYPFFSDDQLLYIPLFNKSKVIDCLNSLNIDKNLVLTNLKSSNFLLENGHENRFLPPSTKKEFHSRAFLKIQDGCNNRCTYCKVCLVRGKSISLQDDIIIERIKKLKNSGFSEIILTGINIAAYSYNGVTFSYLLEKLIDIFPDLIFQLSSIEIINLDSKFFEVITSENIKPYFHLPLQSGSDNILKLMNRRYTVNDFIKTIENIKKIRDDSFISTDVIVGFPGESLKTISETEVLVRKLGFEHLHIFPFSKREGTAAYNFTETFSEKEKSLHIESLRKISNANKNKYINSHIGKQDKMCIESIKKLNDAKYLITGKSYHSIQCLVLTNDIKDLKIGQYIKVKFFGKIGYKLYGILNEN